ncbi:MAG: IPT/TIG domain-containing protein [Bacteroidales bacterium]|nr:IPT/TIG domain-containing protein [Bacteroidales bacterium]
MKKIFGILMMAAVLFASCQKEKQTLVNTPAINVTTEKLDPNTDESGTVRAYAGTQVTAKGLNLDKVGAVKIDGKDATIVEKTMKTLVFEIPAMDKAQQDEPYMVLLEVFDADAQTVIFKYDYFITVPVTDAQLTGFTPKSGTVGTPVTITGRNLDQLTSVSFGGVSVAASAFTSHTGAEVVVAVPAVKVQTADTDLDVAAVWSGGTIPFADKFTLSIPVFNSYSQASAARLGDEVSLTGQNLTLVSAVKWGDEELLIADISDTAITVKVPSGLTQQNPAVVGKALTALYGIPAEQSVTILADFKVDTTPIGPAAPVFASVAPADEGYSGIFLGRTVTVKGENMASIEKFEIDGKEAALAAPATDIQAQFVVPTDISGTAAKEVTLVAIWNGGNRADFGTVTVYPFYYTKGLKIGTGSNSKATYPAFNNQNAFILLDEGRVISADEWNDIPVDAPAKSGTNTVVGQSSKVTGGSKADYYSVKPYMFASASSAHKLAFNNPANSNSQLKTHRLSDLSTSLPSTFGTPIIFMKIMGEGDIKTNVAAGTLTDILGEPELAGTSAPAFGTSEGSTWVKGSVICMQYVTYDHASTTGGKPVDSGDIHKIGFMYVREVTCGDPATGLALESREGYIEIDLYWSNVINE